jgi:hypothetical protein
MLLEHASTIARAVIPSSSFHYRKLRSKLTFDEMAWGVAWERFPGAPCKEKGENENQISYSLSMQFA